MVIDESTGLMDTAQLTIFIIIGSSFNIPEDFLRKSQKKLIFLIMKDNFKIFVFRS